MIRRLFRWLFPIKLESLIAQADRYGRITFQQTELPEGTGWTCSIRAHASVKPRYAWNGTGMTLEDALSGVLSQAKDNPINRIVGTPCAPKLGGAEFDPE